MDSRFLPENFESSKVIVLIAGKGIYPHLTYSRLEKLNNPIRLIAFDDETSEDLIHAFDPKDRAVINVGQIGKLLKNLKAFNASYAIMAGQITPKRLFKGLQPDLKAIAILARLKERNAETIFGAIGEEMKGVGVDLLDSRVFLDDQLAHEGIIAGGKIKVDQEYIDHGIKIAKEMARLDVGQGVVVRKGTVLAVEAFEGTDAMLRRAGTFEAKDSIFIKTTKPNQDYRFDVPVFGMKTLQVMHEANIPYAGLEAHKTIILEKQLVVEKAKELGIVLFGY